MIRPVGHVPMGFRLFWRKFCETLDLNIDVHAKIGRKKPEKIKKTKGEIAREYILKAIFIM